MPGYTFYFHRPSGRTPDFDFADCPDDQQALTLSQRLIADHSTAARVEVFNGERIIGAFAREAAPEQAGLQGR